jgi:acyl-coenzyme A synthetase/AMP-(fatty) acid ligase
MYVGRKDFQVKHAGYRIELGEIEYCTLSLEDVETCGVVYADSEIRLYYTGNAVKDGINAHIKNSLPHYMKPAKIIKLETMPLLSNGKIDRQKLKELMG